LPGFNNQKKRFYGFPLLQQPISAFVGLAHTFSDFTTKQLAISQDNFLNRYFTEPRNSVFLQILFDKEGAGITKRLLKHKGKIKYNKQNKYVNFLVNCLGFFSFLYVERRQIPGCRNKETVSVQIIRY
jgi:hypothetical protein